MGEKVNSKPHYIVFRPCDELKGKVPKEYDGYWYDFNNLPFSVTASIYDYAEAHPTGLYEQRDDGESAEVWIVEPIIKYQMSMSNQDTPEKIREDAKRELEKIKEEKKSNGQSNGQVWRCTARW